MEGSEGGISAACCHCAEPEGDGLNSQVSRNCSVEEAVGLVSSTLAESSLRFSEFCGMSEYNVHPTSRRNFKAAS